jgi:hypothetical protein
LFRLILSWILIEDLPILLIAFLFLTFPKKN